VSSPTARPKATTAQKALLLGMIFIALMIPPAFLTMVGQAGVSFTWVYGGIVALIASFYSARLSIELSTIVGVAGVIAILTEPWPLAVAVVITLLTAGAALASRRGLHNAALLVPIVISLVITAPPTITGVDSSLVIAIVTGVSLCASGLWVTLAVRLVLGSGAPRLPRSEHSLTASITYAAVMAVVVGTAAYIVLALYPIDRGGWLILALIVTLQPSSADTIAKALQRLGGTVIGLAVTLVVALVDLPPWTNLLITSVLLYLALASRFVLPQPYWVYVTLLTPAVLLMNTQAADAFDLASKRLELTAVAALVAIVVALIGKAVVLYLHRGHPTAQIAD